MRELYAGAIEPVPSSNIERLWEILHLTRSSVLRIVREQKELNTDHRGMLDSYAEVIEMLEVLDNVKEVK